MDMQPLPGSSTAVDGHGSAYLNTAAAIREAVTLLQQIRNDETTISKAVDEVRGEVSEVSGQIQQATERYEVTGEALVDYAPELFAAQQQAESAIEEWEAAKQRLAQAEAAKAAAGDDADISGLDTEITAALSAIEAAELRWRDAWHRKDDAAYGAADRIHQVIADADINDSFWDDVRGFFSEAFDWLATAFQAVLETLASLAVEIGLLLAGVALIVAGLAALASGGLLAALALLGAGALATMFTLTGGAGAMMDTWFATGDLQRAFTAGMLKSLTTLLPGVVDWLVDGDLMPAAHKGGVAHDGKVDLSGMTPGEMLAWLHEANLNADKQVGVQGPEGLHNENSSMITVHTVTGPDGEDRYIVNIPSTQVWTPGSGSANDISSGAAAKFSDEQTQLELAVQDALIRAGAEPGDSILLSGWSLGGITAGELAANPEFAAMYDIDGIVVSGSGMDDIAIPSHIPVLQFEHLSDAGPLADPIPTLANPDATYHGGDVNRTIVKVAPPEGTGWLPHVGDAYGATVQQQGDTSGSSAEQWTQHNLGGYFGEGSEGSSESHFYQRGPVPH